MRLAAKCRSPMAWLGCMEAITLISPKRGMSTGMRAPGHAPPASAARRRRALGVRHGVEAGLHPVEQALIARIADGVNRQLHPVRQRARIMASELGWVDRNSPELSGASS
jgi:hypothetical protein